MEQTRRSPHRRAWQVVSKKPGQVLSLLLFQLLLRAIAFIPLIYAAATGTFFGFNKNYALALGFLFSLPLVVLLVLPFRFQAAARKAQLLGYQREAAISLKNYGIWLRAALLRLLRALPCILPFFVFAGLYSYYMPYPDALLPISILSDMGSVVGLGLVGGIIMTGLIGIVSVILAAWGWLQGVYFEHQDVISLGLKQASRNAKALRQRRKRTVSKTVFRNAMLCLPAIIGLLVVLGQHLGLKKTGLLVYDVISYSTSLILFNFPQSVMITLGIILLVLWLPLLPYRKTALAAVMTEGAQSKK